MSVNKASPANPDRKLLNAAASLVQKDVNNLLARINNMEKMIKEKRGAIYNSSKGPIIKNILTTNNQPSTYITRLKAILEEYNGDNDLTKLRALKKAIEDPNVTTILDADIQERRLTGDVTLGGAIATIESNIDNLIREKQSFEIKMEAARKIKEDADQKAQIEKEQKAAIEQREAATAKAKLDAERAVNAKVKEIIGEINRQTAGTAIDGIVDQNTKDKIVASLKRTINTRDLAEGAGDVAYNTALLTAVTTVDGVNKVVTAADEAKAKLSTAVNEAKEVIKAKVDDIVKQINDAPTDEAIGVVVDLHITSKLEVALGTYPADDVAKLAFNAVLLAELGGIDGVQKINKAAAAAKLTLKTEAESAKVAVDAEINNIIEQQIGKAKNDGAIDLIVAANKKADLERKLKKSGVSAVEAAYNSALSVALDGSGGVQKINEAAVVAKDRLNKAAEIIQRAWRSSEAKIILNAKAAVKAEITDMIQKIEAAKDIKTIDDILNPPGKLLAISDLKTKLEDKYSAGGVVVVTESYKVALAEALAEKFPEIENAAIAAKDRLNGAAEIIQKAWRGNVAKAAVDTKIAGIIKEIGEAKEESTIDKILGVNSTDDKIFESLKKPDDTVANKAYNMALLSTLKDANGVQKINEAAVAATDKLQKMVTIQAMVRARIAAEQSRKTKEDADIKAKQLEKSQNNAATKIQKTLRGFLGRKVATGLKESTEKTKQDIKESEAAVEIQSAWRGYEARKSTKQTVQNKLEEFKEKVNANILELNGASITIARIEALKIEIPKLAEQLPKSLLTTGQTGEILAKLTEFNDVVEVKLQQVADVVEEFKKQVDSGIVEINEKTNPVPVERIDTIKGNIEHSKDDTLKNPLLNMQQQEEIKQHWDRFNGVVDVAKAALQQAAIDTNKNAAGVIQRAWRSSVARATARATATDLRKERDGKRLAEAEKEKFQDAATTIQAAWRGHEVREKITAEKIKVEKVINAVADFKEKVDESIKKLKDPGAPAITLDNITAINNEVVKLKVETLFNSLNADQKEEVDEHWKRFAKAVDSARDKLQDSESLGGFEISPPIVSDQPLPPPQPPPPPQPDKEDGLLKKLEWRTVETIVQYSDDGDWTKAAFDKAKVQSLLSKNNLANVATFPSSDGDFPRKIQFLAQPEQTHLSDEQISASVLSLQAVSKSNQSTSGNNQHLPIVAKFKNDEDLLKILQKFNQDLIAAHASEAPESAVKSSLALIYPGTNPDVQKIVNGMHNEIHKKLMDKDTGNNFTDAKQEMEKLNTEIEACLQKIAANKTASLTTASSADPPKIPVIKARS